MKKGIILFIVSILLVSFFYDFHTILFKTNSSVHQWRQADCLSITQNYYKENLPFLKPKQHHKSNELKGERGVLSEFPLIYYTVAKLWKIFGKSEAIFRGLNLFIVFLGLFYLFKTALQYFKNKYLALMFPLFLFTSPILVYYSNNFISNAPAFGLVLIGWYYFYQYYLLSKEKYLLITLGIFLLAGLLKASALFSFFAIGGIFLLELIPKVYFKKQSKIFKKHQVLYFISVLIVFFSWYSYATFYSDSNGNSWVFLKGILPIWELSEDRIIDTFSKIYHIQLNRIFNPFIHLATLSLFVFNILNFKKINPFIITINIFLFLGVLTFCILFFQVFDIHDYYFINTLIFPVFTWFTFFSYLKNNTNLISKKIFYIPLIIILLYSIFISGVINRHKYNTKDVIARSGLDYISEHDKGVMGWFQFDSKKNQEAWKTITPYLRELGIERETPVMVIDDISINISLYNMDQVGYTSYCNKRNFPDKVLFSISKGVEYLIISEYRSTEPGYSKFKKYFKHQVGKHKNLLIFDLKPFSNN